jgi:NifB/MoaA-like Fe-S oxidoreductase
MRPHTRLEAVETVSTVEEWQRRFTAALKRRVVWASDEYYLLAQLRLPEEHDYEGFPQLENGVGMVRAFEKSFGSGLDEDSEEPAGPSSSGCFAGVQGAPAAGYRAVRATRENGSPKAPGTDGGRPITVLTGDYGATVLRPLLDRHGFEAVKVLPVRNEFFGGNIAVAGLITGPDVARTIEGEPSGGRYLLPDVCLSGGRFVDGSAPDELGAAVKVVPTSGAALRRILEEER